MRRRRRRLRIALLAHEFLINIGANDFLKNIIRGLAHDPNSEIIFLHPRSDQRLEHMAPASFKSRFSKHPRIKQSLRAVARTLRPLSDQVVRSHPSDFEHYLEASPGMQLVACSPEVDALHALKDELCIDVFMPSIHVLPSAIPHVNYWPDCQPKHLPEFFDDESQRVRDQRIQGLLETGQPMIINSRDAKNDMVTFYGADPEQIFELPFAPIIEFERLIPRPELRIEYSIRRPYFMVCNQFWIHKSAETVIEAAAICKRHGLDVQFVFTGKLEEPRRPRYIDWIKQLIREVNVEDRVSLLGFIPKASQLELMKGAVAVVQPTLFEGGPGGGSVYDAYSLGVRSIVSDLPVNRELPTDNGRVRFFEKKNASDLFDALQRALKEKYAPPSTEELFQQSRKSTEALSSRLYQAIDCALVRARG